MFGRVHNDIYINIYIYIYMLGSKDLGTYVFRTLICIVGKL